MKKILALAALSMMVATLTQLTTARADESDPVNAKIRIAKPGEHNADCKISRKEIANYERGTVGRRYICAQLESLNSETTLESLSSLLKTNAVAMTYEGKTTEGLVQTLADWKQWLIGDAEDYTSPEKYLTEVVPYEFVVISREGDIVSMKLVNSASGEEVTFQVQLGVQIPKEK